MKDAFVFILLADLLSVFFKLGLRFDVLYGCLWFRGLSGIIIQITCGLVFIYLLH